MEQDDNSGTPRTEEELRLLEQLAKKQKGKPGQKVRHGANTWRQWLDEDDDE